MSQTEKIYFVFKSCQFRVEVDNKTQGFLEKKNKLNLKWKQTILDAI